MKRYEVVDQETGHVYNYYNSIDEADRAVVYANIAHKDRSYTIVELPEVEETDIDLQKIDCILNNIIDNMEELSKLVDLDYISICRASNKSDSGFFIYASNGSKSGTTYVGDRTDIFSSIYKQMKENKSNDR